MAKQNLTIQKGATLSTSFTYKQSDGTPYNLTNWVSRMQVRENVDDVATVLNLTEGSGISISDAVNGVVTLNVSAATTEALTITTGYYDIEIESLAGVVIRLVEGIVTVTEQVTR